MKRKIILIALILILSVEASAFEAKTKWHFRTSSLPTSGIAIHQNIILFGDWIGQIYALDKSSGSVLWTYKGSSESAILGTPAIWEDEVFFAHADGEVTCLKISDGSLIWRYVPYQDDLGFNDGIAVGGGLVFAAKKEGELLALDIKSGHLVWSYKTSVNLQSAPSYSKKYVFLGEDNGIFNIIDAETGKRLNGGGAGATINTPVVYDGNLYISAWDNSVQAVQIKDVIPLWNVNVKDPVSTPPAVSNGVVAVGTARGLVIIINRENGQILWEHNLGSGSVRATPVIADGLVFAGTDHGNLEVLDVQTGEVKFTIQTSYEIASSPAYSDGVFYFFGKGEVQALQ